MKRTLSLALMLVAVCSLVFADTAPSGAGLVPPLPANGAFVILNSLPLYLDSGSTLTYKESLSIGDRVTLYNKTYKFKVDGKEREYTKIKAPSGTEGWVRSAYIVAKSTLAVVKVDKSIVYSEPRDVKITSNTVSYMTIVAVLTEGSTTTFSRILCYDPTQDAYYTDPAVFVSKDDLSFAETDVNAVILYMTAMSTKNKDVRANLFKVIEKRYSPSIFFEKIRSVLSPVAAAPVAKPSQPASGIYVLNDSNVNVRATPDEVNGQVVAQLNKGTKVEVLEVTTSTYTVGGQTAYWYRIKDPAGWIFGSFIVPAN